MRHGVPSLNSVGPPGPITQRRTRVYSERQIPPRYYTGIASDPATRLRDHNAGACRHIAKYRPWSVDVVIEFPDEGRAVAFERYLKSGSGVAFAQCPDSTLIG